MPSLLAVSALHHYLTWGATPPTRSAFAGIAKLAPGHTATFAAGVLTEHRYWTLPAGTPTTFAGLDARLLSPDAVERVLCDVEAFLGDVSPALMRVYGNWLATLTSIEWFRSIGESVTIVTGFIFIVCVLAFRRGIVGEIGALLKRSAPARH